MRETKEKGKKRRGVRVVLGVVLGQLFVSQLVLGTRPAARAVRRPGRGLLERERVRVCTAERGVCVCKGVCLSRSRKEKKTGERGGGMQHAGGLVADRRVRVHRGEAACGCGGGGGTAGSGHPTTITVTAEGEWWRAAGCPGSAGASSTSRPTVAERQPSVRKKGREDEREESGVGPRVIFCSYFRHPWTGPFCLPLSRASPTLDSILWRSAGLACHQQVLVAGNPRRPLPTPRSHNIHLLSA